jgi:hypothetical protein
MTSFRNSGAADRFSRLSANESLVDETTHGGFVVAAAGAVKGWFDGASEESIEITEPEVAGQEL